MAIGGPIKNTRKKAVGGPIKKNLPLPRKRGTAKGRPKARVLSAVGGPIKGT